MSVDFVPVHSGPFSFVSCCRSHFATSAAVLAAIWLSALAPWQCRAENRPPANALPVVAASASSAHADFPATAAADGDRFSVQRGRLWKGLPGQNSWIWTADLGQARSVGAILQVVGDEESYAACAPLCYAWQSSHDGVAWVDVDRTHVVDDRRMYRIHRLGVAQAARYWRIVVTQTGGEPPAIREVEFYQEPGVAIDFPDWLLVVSSHHEPTLATCHRYLDLARKCDGWKDVTAQFLWHADLDPHFVDVEPQPLCLLFGGSTLEWCQVDRSGWKGVETLLREAKHPMWGACGGGQVFGILEEHGTDVAWDCPNCRDPQCPKTPIYGHIGRVDPTRSTSCSNYANNVYEKGPTPVRLVGEDPVFAGLPVDFRIPEYHCGQLDYLPKGWDLVVTRGNGGKTWMQCMKKRGTCVYGAQFHIEHQGTPDASRTIMTNFLREAKTWRRNRQQPKGDETVTVENDGRLTAADQTPAAP